MTQALYVVLAFVGGAGLTTALFAGWIADLRRNCDFWHQQYLATDQTRRELVEALLHGDQQ